MTRVELASVMIAIRVDILYIFALDTDITLRLSFLLVLLQHDVKFTVDSETGARKVDSFEYFF